MSKSTVAIRTFAAAVALLVSVLCAGDARAQDDGAQMRGSRDLASIPSPTGMIYYGDTLEMLPNGQYRLTDYPIVTRVDSGSVSWAAGLKLEDVLLSVNGRDGREPRLFRLQHGETRWVIRIRRETEEKEVVMEVPPTMRTGSASSPAPRP